jgi:twitching motility protein PilT
VLRTIPSRVLSLEELQCPRQFADFSGKPRGLVLVTGPTGSGKSTTLAAMVDHVNNNLYGHILTIEDPIEFVHESRKSVINQREVGPHTLSFANALRSALREDPDVVLVGEIARPGNDPAGADRRRDGPLGVRHAAYLVGREDH